MLRAAKGVTLIELLVAVSLIFLVILALTNIDIFGRTMVISSSNRALLQNELSTALEHISKNIVHATGDQLLVLNRPIQMLTNGFRVRVDPRVTPTQTLQDLNDDVFYSYTLTGNTLSVSCAPAALCPIADQVLSTHILEGFVNGIMPTATALIPASPGFYVFLPPADNATTVEVGLVARFDPNNPVVGVNNPQIQMKNRMHTPNAPAS